MTERPPESPAPVEWRLSGPPLLQRAVPMAVGLWIAGTGLARLLDPAHQRSGSDVVLVVGHLLLLVAFAAATVVTARTRVRVTDAGIEVRETSTRQYAWADVTDVRADPPGRPRWAVLDLADGRRRALPAPSGVLRRAGDSTVEDAVQELRRWHRRNRPRSD